VANGGDDEAALERLGYVQQLRRGMGAFGSFAISFSVISILTGAVSLYGFGLNHGGPIEMAIGWPVVTLMTLPVALSLAELASAYPTAGALYHWASILGGRTLGWVTAWLNLVGQVAVVAGVDYAFAEFVGAALKPEPTRTEILGIYALVLLSHGLLNHIGIRVVNVLNELSAWYHLLGTALLVGALVWMAPLRPASFLLERFVGPESDRPITYPFAYACLIGLLQAQWTFTGYDASAHAAEETVGAREAAPRGIVNSVLVSGIAGMAMLVAITLAIQDLPAAAGAANPFKYIVERALGGWLGRGMVWMVIGAMWFCGLSSVTSNSRMLFAFARDGGPPLSGYLAQVSDRYRTPTWAVWTCVAIAFLLAVWGRAYSVIVSISTIGLYAAYGLPILLAFFARQGGRCERGPWHLGRWSPAVNLVALVWIAFITVLFVLPPNERTGYTFAVLVALLALGWFAGARWQYRGPASARLNSDA
jgi:amino acid transporter